MDQRTTLKNPYREQVSNVLLQLRYSNSLVVDLSFMLPVPLIKMQGFFFLHSTLLDCFLQLFCSLQVEVCHLTKC